MQKLEELKGLIEVLLEDYLRLKDEMKKTAYLPRLPDVKFKKYGGNRDVLKKERDDDHEKMDELIEKFELLLREAIDNKNLIVCMTVMNDKYRNRFNHLLQSYGYHVFIHEDEMVKDELIEANGINWDNAIIVRIP